MGMEIDKRHPADGDGCLVGVLRIPVKIVAVLVVLPVRVVWELLVAFGRAARRHVLGPFYTYVLEPVLRALGWALTVLLKLVFVWPWAGLWRYVLAPVGRAVHVYLLSPVGQALYRYLLRPIGRGLAWFGGLTWRYVLVPVGQGLVWLGSAFYRYLLRPVGLAIAWLVRGLYRYVLTPVGQVIAWAWHVAGRIVSAVWRGFKWVGWILVGWPVSGVYRYVLTPVGHLVREAWRTVRAVVREVLGEVRRALFGGGASQR